eukprot:484952_1
MALVSEMLQLLISFINEYEVKPRGTETFLSTMQNDGEHIYKLCNINYYLQKRSKLANSKMFGIIQSEMFLRFYSLLDESYKMKILNIFRHYGMYTVCCKIIQSDHQANRIDDMVLFSECVINSSDMNINPEVDYQLQRDVNIYDSEADNMQFLLMIYLTTIVLTVSNYTRMSWIDKYFMILLSVNNGNSFICATNKLFLGSLILLGPQMILNYLHKTTITELRIWLKNHKLLSKRLTQCKCIKDIKKYGRDMIQNALIELEELNNSEKLNAQTFIDYFKYNFDHLSLLNTENIKSFCFDIILIIYGKFNLSNLPSSCWYVMQLIALSKYYYWRKQYWIGYKTLQNAY